MLTNFHTHTSFCDGANSPEEVVLYAIDKGFDALGFSGHGYTHFDTSYCIQDMNEYVKTLRNLQEKYKNKLQIYVGVEEDLYSLINRSDFDYIIGSSHYFKIQDKYYCVDAGYEELKKFLKFTDGNPVMLAELYFDALLKYINSRKPDIIGHFDLITKFDEVGEPIFSSNKDYIKLADKCVENAVKADCLFEVNTGAISRGYRTFPYPSEELLYTLKKHDGKLILSSDSHNINTLDFYFEETKKILKDIGFNYVYTFYDGKIIKDNI